MADYINEIPDDFDPNEFARENNQYEFHEQDDMGMRELYSDTDDAFYENLRSTDDLRRKYLR